MNELELLKRWGNQMDTPGATPPPSVRARVLRREPVRRTRMPRTAWSVSLSAALALAVTAVFVWSANSQNVEAPKKEQAAPPAAPVSVNEILRGAAVRVAQEKSVAPRADQFIFTETVNGGGVEPVPPNEGTHVVTPSTAGPKQVRQSWESVDGTRDGLLKGKVSTDPDWAFVDVTPVCRDGKMRGETMACVTVPAVLPELPTDADAMVEYLNNRREVNWPGAVKNVAAFNVVLELFDRYYLSPAVKAALFEALSRLPGVTKQDNVVDLAGRPGVGVHIEAPDGTSTKGGDLIFDPKTYTFLGTTFTAVLRQAVVDNPGEMP
jgi:hypothetical protein